MLTYRNRSHLPLTPAELDGFTPHDRPRLAVCHQDCGGWHHVAIADPAEWCAPESCATWAGPDDGWQVADDGRPWEPADLLRARRWTGGLPVEDLSGRRWLAPCILGPDGRRMFPAKLGVGFAPVLTSEQEHAVAIVAEYQARVAAKSADLGTEVLAPWAAELLAITHHVSPATIAAAGLLDEDLAVAVLLVAAGEDPRILGEDDDG